MKPLIKFNNISKTNFELEKLFINFDNETFKYRNIQLSVTTKKILNEMINRNTIDKELKKVAYRLDDSFFDEIFDNFISLNDKEQEKFIEVLTVFKKRRFKNNIYQNLLNNYNHKNIRKMAYLLSDKFKPSILKLAHSIFLDMMETQSSSYLYYKKTNSTGLFSFVKMIEPTGGSPFSVNVTKSLLEQTQQNDYFSNEKDEHYNFLVNHYNDEDGAKYGLHYLKTLDPKTYDPRVISYIIKCKNTIQHRYNELANELDLLLYKIYEYSLINNDYSEIADELAMTLTNKIISEAFGDDERSLFWKRYINSIIEPIIFVKYPVQMFMMKFKSIGIIEYIDIGNATYLYNDEEFINIKRKILKSSNNEKNILNINCLLNQYRLKEITKIGENKYIHRGSWKIEFKKDMIRKYDIFPK